MSEINNSESPEIINIIETRSGGRYMVPIDRYPEEEYPDDYEPISEEEEKDLVEDMVHINGDKLGAMELTH